MPDERPTPGIEYFYEIVDYLYAEKLIVPAQISPFEAFEINENGNVFFNFDKGLFWVNVQPSTGNYMDMVQRLIYPKSEEFLQDKDLCYELWKKVAVGEVLHYLENSLNEVRIPYETSKKTYQIFGHLLDHFSIRQIFRIITSTVANASKGLLEGRITIESAANSIIKHCENYGVKAIAENWKISSYDKPTPQSTLTKMLFNGALGISYLGYEEKPTKDL